MIEAPLWILILIYIGCVHAGALVGLLGACLLFASRGPR